MTGEQAGRTEPYWGHAGMREYFRDVAAVWEELRLTPREFRTEGDLVLVTGKVSARSRARTVTGSTGWIWRVRAARSSTAGVRLRGRRDGGSGGGSSGRDRAFSRRKRPRQQ